MLPFDLAARAEDDRGGGKDREREQPSGHRRRRDGIPDDRRRRLGELSQTDLLIMNAIVPLNITALRVNANDNSNIVSQFKGRTAVFEQLPFDPASKQASTG